VSFVLDNSVTMRWYFGDGKRDELAYAERVLELMRGRTAHVPAIWGLEVSNVLGRAEARGLTTEARSETFIALLERMDISIDPMTSAHALASTLHIARRHKLSSYDACYLELAMREGLPLATLDDELQRAAKRAGVERLTA
jgi:predicted nucleic acid-binding protein